MKRYLTLALIASISINIVGLVGSFRGRSSAVSANVRSMSQLPDESGRASGTKPTPKIEAVVDPHAELRDKLRRLGLSETAIRAAIAAVLAEPRLRFERELCSKRNSEWWRNPSRAEASVAERSQLRLLRKSERDEMRRLLGPDAMVNEDDALRYQYISKDMLARLSDIRFEFNDEYDGFCDTSPSLFRGHEAENKLADVWRRYLQRVSALLPPEESALWCISNTPGGAVLGRAFSYFDLKDSEFIGIYNKNVADGRLGNGIDSNTVMDILGADRFNEWRKSQRPEQRALVDLVREIGLDDGVVEHVRRLPETYSALANEINADTTLNPEERRARLQDLARRARAETLGYLGGYYGPAFLSSPGNTWINVLEAGGVFSIFPDGRMRIDFRGR